MKKTSLALNLALIVIVIWLLQTRNESRIVGIMDYVDSHEFYPLTITAYNSYLNQTDHRPSLTASGRKTSYQTLALSRDLISRYNHPEASGFEYGDTVTIVLSKEIIIEDTMGRRFRNRANVWTEIKAEAREFGIKQGIMIRRKR